MRRPLFFFTLAGLLAGCGAHTSSQVKPSQYGETRTFKAVDRFEITEIAPLTKGMRAWFELPMENEPAQRIADLKIDSPLPYTLTRDPGTGNRFLYVEVPPTAALPLAVTVSFTTTRREIAGTNGETEPGSLDGYLESDPYVVVNDQVRELAAKAVEGKATLDEKARALYDWVMGYMEYWVKDQSHLKASGKGLTAYALEKRTGNCSEFHALYGSCCKALGIPSRMVFGSMFRKRLDGKNEDQSYHCWQEYWDPEKGWVPIDVAFADLFEKPGDFAKDQADLFGIPNDKDYYFQRLDARRVSFSRGRNLNLVPKQWGDPLPFFVKGYVEADGKEHKGWTRTLTYTETKG